MLVIYLTGHVKDSRLLISRGAGEVKSWSLSVVRGGRERPTKTSTTKNHKIRVDLLVWLVTVRLATLVAEDARVILGKTCL